MRLFRTTEEAYEHLGPENANERVRVGYPGLYDVYRFDWNDRHNEGVLNFQYQGGSASIGGYRRGRSNL